jgi:hypothetical protein
MGLVRNQFLQKSKFKQNSMKIQHFIFKIAILSLKKRIMYRKFIKQNFK